ncbi:unnamed protein product [Protopolystoma xenopodis]|uniref:Uncharacterized protein n=1 Tax=Protopolystoma xenopodis TaxID=117903 RepID=A0A3S5FDK9_9PLAT|nr:unnamed protein product [Protopolystoma xenopodis]
MWVVYGCIQINQLLLEPPARQQLAVHFRVHGGPVSCSEHQSDPFTSSGVSEAGSTIHSSNKTNHSDGPIVILPELISQNWERAHLAASSSGSTASSMSSPASFQLHALAPSLSVSRASAVKTASSSFSNLTSIPPPPSDTIPAESSCKSDTKSFISSEAEKTVFADIQEDETKLSQVSLSKPPISEPESSPLFIVAIVLLGLNKRKRA